MATPTLGLSFSVLPPPANFSRLRHLQLNPTLPASSLRKRSASSFKTFPHPQTKNHIFTSGGSGSNAAMVRGALRTENPELLTVILPQSLSMQTAESQEMLSQVTITPEVASKKVYMDIMKNLVKEYSGSYLWGRLIAYDGSKSAYTAGELPFTSKYFVVKLIDNDRVVRREREFKVSTKFSAKHSLFHLQQFLQGRHLDSLHETIQVIDVALRTDLSLE